MIRKPGHSLVLYSSCVAWIACQLLCASAAQAANTAWQSETTPQVENPPAAPDEPAEKSKQDGEAPSPARVEANNEVSTRRRPTFDKQSVEILESLAPVTSNVERATVRILTQGRPIALGLIVESDGFVLTKASELKGNLMCKLSDGRNVSASVYGIHEKTDLALLKIEASQLPSATWSHVATPSVGHWVVTPKLDSPPGLGIVSVQPRLIKPPIGYVGVELRDHEKGVRIYKILANSPAEKAGLQVNDVIIEVDGQKIESRGALVESIQRNPVGAEIQLKVLRGDETLDFPIVLTDQSVFGSDWDRNEIQNEMGGRLSKRRLDFPMALQHDTPLSPNDCGGPIVDLSGEIVGINIARAGRVDSLALPAATVLSVIDLLKSGELRPEIIHKQEIEKVRLRILEIDGKLNVIPEATGKLQETLDEGKIRADELRKAVEEAQARLKEVEDENAKTEKALNEENTESTQLQKEKERLERDLQKLTTGTN